MGFNLDVNLVETANTRCQSPAFDAPSVSTVSRRVERPRNAWATSFWLGSCDSLCHAVCVFGQIKMNSFSHRSALSKFRFRMSDVIYYICVTACLF